MTDLEAFFAANPGPVGLTLSATGDRLRLTGSAALLAEGSPAGVVEMPASSQHLRELRATAQAAHRRLWVADALATSRRHGVVLAAAGWELGEVHCAKTALRALDPRRGREAPSPGVGAVRSLVEALRGRSEAERQAALRLHEEEVLVRRRALTGWRVDERLARRLWRELDDEVRAIAGATGAPMGRGREARAEWLASIGVIAVTDTDGFLDLERCDVSNCTEPEKWFLFRRALRQRTQAGVLRNLLNRVENGRVVPESFEVNSAVTGRMAARRPGVLGLARDFRPVLRPVPGRVIVGVDHSGAELRVLAVVSGCERLRQSILAGDPYEELAAACGLDRAAAKIGALAWSYGQRLAGATAVHGEAEARALHEAIERLWPGLVRAKAEMVERARGGEQLHTLRGRRLPVPARPELALNLVVQGSARDYFGECLQRIAARGWDLFMPLHDAAYVEVDATVAPAIARELEEAMTVDLGNGILLRGTPEVMTAWH